MRSKLDFGAIAVTLLILGTVAMVPDGNEVAATINEREDQTTVSTLKARQGDDESAWAVFDESKKQDDALDMEYGLDLVPTYPKVDCSEDYESMIGDDHQEAWLEQCNGLITRRQNNNSPTCGLPDNTCFGNPAGDCCSVYGWCGNGPEYCSQKVCDAEWGYCYGDHYPGPHPAVQNDTRHEHAARIAARQDVSLLVAAIEAVAALDNMTESLEERTELVARQDVSLLVAAIEAVAALDNMTETLGEREAMAQQDTSSVVHVWSTVTASPSIVYVDDGSASSAYNVTGIVYETQAQAVSNDALVATVATVVTEYVTASTADGYRSSTTSTTRVTSTRTNTMTQNVTLTDPINTHITTVVPLNHTRAHSNNTSIDTNIYLNISTFSAPGLPSLSHGITSLGTVTTTSNANEPSTTTTHSGGENGMLGFTPAVTSDVGRNHSSAATKVIEVPGSYLPMLAGIGLAGVFGLFVML
ncbi:hypothetical protein LTR08_007732 [Meristemomyces frigidus]|nr:hypothetical protein LTR08_007732 [Meristemomyces frigidus]